jgi:pimeloyl-ACP methyl ester carboxylesterase
MSEITIPDAAEERWLTMPDGAEILLRRMGKPGGPRLALSHGNGLAIDLYAPFWLPLLDRYDVILFDLRCHGRNPVGGAGDGVPARPVETMAADIEQIWQGITAAFGDKPVAGVFHSAAAISALLHVIEHDHRWDMLFLVDPPIYPRDGHPLQATKAPHNTRIAELTRRRPDRFDDLDIYIRMLRTRPQFRRLVSGVPELFAASTFRQEADGGYILRCPKELEARYYEQNVHTNIWPALAELPMPVFLLGGDPNSDWPSPVSKIVAEIARETGVPYQMVPDTSHLLQIERPNECREVLKNWLAGEGFGAG